jgi:cytosine/adenosine deaminase-related metal-dependent hydrolase
MTTLLIHRARCMATQDDANTELNDASLLIRDGRIERIIPATENTDELVKQVDEVIDARRHVVVPGLINTHHHMYQSLTRAIPGVQNAELFSWLQGLYPIWVGLTPEMVRVSGQVAMAELLLSGCTTSSDHLYIYPNGVRLDDSIEAAHTIGMRFTATRGSMSVGQSQGGLPPDAAVEQEPAILKETQRLIETWHDASYGSMTHVAVAPCSPFSVSQDLMREAAKLARAHGVRLHTHLAENDHDIAYTRAIRRGPGLGGPRRVARPWCEARRRRHVFVCPHAHRHCALPLQQHASGQRHLAFAQDAERRCAHWFGRGWQRQQRCRASAERSPPGHAAGPRGPRTRTFWV